MKAIIISNQRKKGATHMSQQHMESDRSQSSEPASYNTGYKQPLYYNDDSLSSVGHKLTWREQGELPKDEFRLGLAIVTLLSFLVLILTFAGLGFTSLANDKVLYVGTGITMLILFSIVAIIINAMFNRRR
jgi:hypothetical protein